MTDTTAPPSVLIRDAKRAWLRNHPNGASLLSRHGVRRASELSRDNLDGAIRELGGDPRTIADCAVIISLDDLNDYVAAPHDLTQAKDAAPAMTDTATTTTASRLDAIRTGLAENGWNGMKGVFADLLAQAEKPAEVKIVEKIVDRVVHVTPAAPLAPGLHDLKPVRTATWRDLFGPAMSNSHKITVWDYPASPRVNPIYRFPAEATALALSQLARGERSRALGGPGKHPLLKGPAGTGKSAWCEQFAALTGRPFVLVPMSDGLEMDELIGQTVLDGNGGTKWQDGVMLAAIRQPGTVICLDEVGGMRAAVGIAMNSLLQTMAYTVPSTGERVACAPGVIFVATNNGNLLDDGRTNGYEGVRRQARSFADRFGVSIDVGYLPQADEAALLVSYTGCTKALAKLLVSVAALSREKADATVGDLTGGIGFRRLLAWAEVLTDGADPARAFRSCILNAAPMADAEVLTQLALTAVDPAAIATALGNKAPAPVAISAAGLDFTAIV